MILMALAVAVVASLSPQNTKRIEWKERIKESRLVTEVGRHGRQDIKTHENWSQRERERESRDP